MEAANRTATLDQRHYNALVPGAVTDGAVGLLADVRLVDLDMLASAANRWGLVARAHRLADAVGHEPRRLVGDDEHTVQLVGRNALLAGRH